MGSPLQRRFRYAKKIVTTIGRFFGNGRRGCLLTLKQSLPNGIHAGAQRGNPPHTGNRQPHASPVRCSPASEARGESGTLRIISEAFVPPNPNEFESATLTAAGRASFATMLRSTSSSAAV